MRETYSPPPSVVVGIDGSRAAVRAALWAVDAAVSRDIPLRLVCAIPPGGTMEADPQDEARKLAAAEDAVRNAFMAVESTEKTCSRFMHNRMVLGSATKMRKTRPPF